jgi:hypothetical protein
MTWAASLLAAVLGLEPAVGSPLTVAGTFALTGSPPDISQIADAAGYPGYPVTVRFTVDDDATAPGDDHTPSSGLNYNLRVSTGPGVQYVIAPQADLITGLRRLSERGNAGPTTHWRLVDLPRGNYF